MTIHVLKRWGRGLCLAREGQVCPFDESCKQQWTIFAKSIDKYSFFLMCAGMARTSCVLVCLIFAALALLMHNPEGFASLLSGGAGRFSTDQHSIRSVIANKVAQRVLQEVKFLPSKVPGTCNLCTIALSS
jgi:hypothetical protein